MIPLQVQLEHWLGSFACIGAFMQLSWTWPIVESAHFVGLTLLLGRLPRGT